MGLPYKQYLQFLNNVIINKTKVLLPQEQVTLTGGTDVNISMEEPKCLLCFCCNKNVDIKFSAQDAYSMTLNGIAI
jgi:hypothetical protein